MATTQDLAQQNQELQAKLLEYHDCSTQATTQINKDVHALNQRLSDMEKNIQAAIITTINQALATQQPVPPPVINIPPPQAAPPAAQTPKVPKPYIKKFNGNPTKYATWKFQVNQANLIYNLADLAYIAFMGQNLSGAAHTWYQTIYDNQIATGILTTSAPFITLMDWQFTDYGEQDHLCQRLFGIKQGTKPLHFFNQDFNNILLHIALRPAEPDLLYLYLHAIDNRTAVQIANTKPATLNDAMAAAFEQVQYIRTFDSHPPREPFTPRNPSTPQYPKAPQTSPAQPTPPGTGSRIPKSQFGTSNKPSAYPATPKTPYKSPATPQDPNYKCWNCKQPGHFTNQCPL
jgi:hypothetical protein